MKFRFSARALLGSLLCHAACADTADIIYHGGPILTMNDAAPRAEAVAVKSGKILAVGALDAVMKTRETTTKVVNLGGRA